MPKEITNEDISKIEQLPIDIGSSSKIALRGEAAPLTEEEIDFEIARREQIIREKDLGIQQHKEEHSLRKLYLRCSFVFVVIFVGIVMLVLVLSSCNVLRLSDSVLITLLTTTTANVLGVLFISFKWLFPSIRSK